MQKSSLPAIRKIKTSPSCECYALQPCVAEDEKLIGNWIFNKFNYSGGVCVVVVWGVEHKIEKYSCRLVGFYHLFKYKICKSKNTNTDTITAPMALFIWYLKRWFPFSVLLFPIISTVSCQYCWGILISFFLLYQIVMDQPSYARPRRCHLGTTHNFDSFVRGCVP